MPVVNSKFNLNQDGREKDFSNMPTFQEARHKVLTMQSPNIWNKPAFAILLITGCRVSELLALRKKDIIWTDENKNPVEPLEDLSNVKLVWFNLITLKRRNINKPMRRFPVLNDVRYRDLLKVVWSYWMSCPNEDFLLFDGLNRILVWSHIKKWLDEDYYPHLFRHISATYYAQNGVIGAGLKRRFGWARETSAEPYVNIGDNYLLEKEYEISAKSGGLIDNKPKKEHKLVM